MQNNIVAAGITGFCLVVAQACTAVPRPAHPPKLEGMAYPAARAVVLRNGWKPLSGDCEATGASCGTYPEIGACSSVAPGYCGMVFTRGDRCLYLVTTGGVPGGTGADARVKSVNFRKGPCGKN